MSKKALSVPRVRAAEKNRKTAIQISNILLYPSGRPELPTENFFLTKDDKTRIKCAPLKEG
ncbi:MAG: hypothetical protein V2I97_22070 [Desulfococcaceae bacterium]|nr:hypothetical protein [Desulfococcaceae bacterium]